MTLPGVPCIYYGDEIGLHGGDGSRFARRISVGVGDWDDEIRGVRGADGRPAAGTSRPAAWEASACSRRLRPRWRGQGVARGTTRRRTAATSVMVGLNSGEQPTSLMIDEPGLAGRDSGWTRYRAAAIAATGAVLRTHVAGWRWRSRRVGRRAAEPATRLTHGPSPALVPWPRGAAIPAISGPSRAPVQCRPVSVFSISSSAVRTAPRRSPWG